MTFDPNSFVRPVFIDKNRQRIYDKLNPTSQIPGNVADIVDNFDTNAVASNVNNQASNFSERLAGFNQGNFRNAIRRPVQPAQQPYNPAPQNASPTAPISTDLNKLGAITTTWGDSTRYEKFHHAVDVANKPGTPIPAFTGGTVTSVETGKKQGDNGFGNNIIVTDAQGNKQRYSHLHQAYVKVGQKVGAGQPLGTMGNSGSTYSPSGKGTGTHLDYRIVDAYNNYINPYTYLKKFT